MSSTIAAKGEEVSVDRRRGLVAVLWFLSALFLVRVLGQAIQRWAPQPFLPAFGEFQGSGLPYWALLTAQLAILAAMARAAWRATEGATKTSVAWTRGLMWFGAIYLGGSVMRVIVGLTVPSAPRWFATWIPAAFHLVLASWVLALGAVHRAALRGQADAA
jgi:hypothetical protein